MSKAEKELQAHGGTAFPVRVEYDKCFPGMSLRDYFAAKAMQALITLNATHPDDIAGLAYEAADSMLRTRDE